MDSVQELAHDGPAGLELLEAAVLDEVLVVGPGHWGHGVRR